MLPPEFWARVEKTQGADGCWLWQGVDALYGMFRGTVAHRLSYEDAYGPIPQGLEIDHLCSVFLCVRPDHLEAVTHVINVMRGWAKRRLNYYKAEAVPVKLHQRYFEWDWFRWGRGREVLRSQEGIG